MINVLFNVGGRVAESKNIDKFADLDIPDHIKSFFRDNYPNISDYNNLSISIKLNGLGGMVFKAKKKSVISFSNDGLITQEFFKKDIKPILSFLVDIGGVAPEDIKLFDFFNNEVVGVHKDKLIEPIKRINPETASNIVADKTGNKETGFDLSAPNKPYIFGNQDIESFELPETKKNKEVKISPKEIISKMPPPKRVKTISEQEREDKNLSRQKKYKKINKGEDNQTTEEHTVSPLLAADIEEVKAPKEWHLKENRKFLRIIKNWYDSTGAENHEEFLKKHYIDNVISAQDFKDVMEGNAVLSKESMLYLSAFVPPGIWGHIWFRGMGLRALEIAGDKRIVGNDPAEITNSVINKLSEILNDRLVYAKTFRERPEFYDRKFEEFIDGFSDIAQGWMEKTGRKSLTINFDEVINDISAHLGITYQQFKGKEVVFAEQAEKAAKAFASMLKDPQNPSDLDSYNELYELANNFWSRQKEKIDGVGPHNAIGVSVRFIRKYKGMNMADFSVPPERISFIENGISHPMLNTVNTIFGDFDLSKNKPDKKEESEFDRVTILFKDTIRPFQVTSGVGGPVEITKEGFILIRALQQKDLKKGFEVIKSEKEGALLGTYLRYIRMYADKPKNGEHSVYELDKQQPNPETFVRLFKTYNLSRKNEPESDHDIAINAVTELLAPYSKSNKKQHSTRESMHVVKALLEPNMDKALGYLRNEDLRKAIGNIVKYVRLREDKTMYEYKYDGRISVLSHRLSKIEKGESFPQRDTLMAIFKDCKKIPDEDFDKITNYLREEVSARWEKGAPSKEDILMIRALRKGNLKAGLEIIKNESGNDSNEKAANGVRFIREYKERKNTDFGINEDVLDAIEANKTSISEISFNDMFKSGAVSKEAKPGEVSEFDTAVNFFNDILPYRQKGARDRTVKEDLIIAVAMQKDSLDARMDLVAKEIKGDDLINVYVKFLRVNKQMETTEISGLDRQDITDRESGKKPAKGEYLIKLFAGLNYDDEDLQTILKKFDEHIYIGSEQKNFGTSPRTIITFSHSIEGKYNPPGAWEKYLANENNSNNTPAVQPIVEVIHSPAPVAIIINHSVNDNTPPSSISEIKVTPAVNKKSSKIHIPVSEALLDNLKAGYSESKHKNIDSRFIKVTVLVDKQDLQTEYQVLCNDMGKTLYSKNYVHDAKYDEAPISDFKAFLKENGIRDKNFQILFKTGKGKYRSQTEIDKHIKTEKGESDYKFTDDELRIARERDGQIFIE